MQNLDGLGSCSTLKSANNIAETKWVNDVVVTVFWENNFDCIVETQAGGGAINSTHLGHFQEKTLQCSSSDTCVNKEEDKRRSINLEINEDMFQPMFDTKK